MKLRPVSKSSDDSLGGLTGAGGGSEVLYSELARLLRDEKVDNEDVIDWIDVSRTLCLSVCLSVCQFVCPCAHICFQGLSKWVNKCLLWELHSLVAD